jgi:phosphoglycolate phosphatase
VPTFSLIVFDLDGTLIDSRRDLAESANEMLAGYGCEPLPVDRVASMVGEGARLLVERACRAAGLAEVPPDALARYLEVYGRRLFDHTRAYPGVGDALVQLSAAATLAVLTNKPLRPAERLLAHFGLAPRVAAVIGGDGEWPRKPDPAALRGLMARFGASPEATCLVGDSWIDAVTARQAGVAFCWARYGFGATDSPDGSTGEAALVVDTPAQLVDTLLGRKKGTGPVRLPERRRAD